MSDPINRIVIDFRLFKDFDKETAWLSRKAQERNADKRPEAAVGYLITAGAMLGSMTVGDQVTLDILLRTAQTIARRIEREGRPEDDKAG